MKPQGLGCESAGIRVRWTSADDGRTTQRVSSPDLLRSSALLELAQQESDLETGHCATQCCELFLWSPTGLVMPREGQEELRAGAPRVDCLADQHLAKQVLCDQSPAHVYLKLGATVSRCWTLA